MSNWDRQIGAMTLYVQNLDSTKAFYQQAFGLQPQFEEAGTAAFRFKDLFVFLQQADELPAQASAVLAKGSDGVGQFAIIVDDVDSVCAELQSRGVELLSGPADRPWGMRTVTFTDPGGYIWEIAQEVAEDSNV
jgi:catechol 2,3-dioxygenase-like lactoylglutathione lyase family enzyme